MSRLDRRRFLEDSMFAAALAVGAGSASSLLAAEPKEKKGSKNPADRLNCAVVGVKGRGMSHVGGYTSRNDTLITWVVDVDTAIGEQRAQDIAKRQGGVVPKVTTDLRKALEDKELNVVSIATPNHWHSLGAIWAMQAGKDVYVEKPVSHNVSEGRRAVEAARKYNKICQTGTQCRSQPGSKQAIEYVRSGKIGEVKVARGLCYKTRNSIGAKGTYEVPSTVDYNLWCGPAPMDPLTRPKLHYDWHWVWSTGNGDFGNQGIHQVDVARWGLGVDQLCNKIFSYGGRIGYEDAGETPNTQVVAFDYGPKTLIFEVRGLKTDAYKGAKVGNVFYGTDGYVVLTSYNSGAAFNPKGEKIAEFGGEGGGDGIHFDNFIDAVRSRKHTDLAADILEGHLSSALCHLGNISHRLGKNVAAGEVKNHLQGELATETFGRFMQHLADNKLDPSTQISLGPSLALNPESETFVDNSAADAMLTREYRAPFVVPPKGQV
jgi:predicted dehydrogenase